MDNKLPAEVVEKLLRARDALVFGDKDEAYHQLYAIACPKFDSFFPWKEMEEQINYPNTFKTDIEARRQVTEYATKLIEAQQEIEQLKRWKSEAAELLNPILDYGQSKDASIPLGESITAVVLERGKQAVAIQAKCERYEAALKVAQIALETCYDVISYPANGETRQDEAIDKIIEALSGEGEKEVENA